MDDLAHSLAAGLPGGEQRASGCAEGWPLLQTQPALCDDAERSLRTQHEAVRAWAGAAARQAARLEPALWREHSRRFDEVVDVGVVGGVVAAGARRHPAADGGPREALRKVAQRQALGLQGGFQVRAQHSRLDKHGARDGVQFEHGVHVVEIDGDRRCGISRRTNAPDHRRAAAVGHDGVAFTIAPGQRGFELVFVARVGDRIRRVVELAAQTFEEFETVTAVGVRRALDLGCARPRRQTRRHRQARRGQIDMFHIDRLRRRHFRAQARGQVLGGRLAFRLARLVRDVAPSPDAATFATGGHGSSLQCSIPSGDRCGFDLVAVQVVDEAAVVVRAVHGPQSRWAVVLAAGG